MRVMRSSSIVVLHLPNTYKVPIPLQEATDSLRISLFRGYRLLCPYYTNLWCLVADTLPSRQAFYPDK